MAYALYVCVCVGAAGAQDEVVISKTGGGLVMHDYEMHSRRRWLEAANISHRHLPGSSTLGTSKQPVNNCSSLSLDLGRYLHAPADRGFHPPLKSRITTRPMISFLRFVWSMLLQVRFTVDDIPCNDFKLSSA